MLGWKTKRRGAFLVAANEIQDPSIRDLRGPVFDVDRMAWIFQHKYGVRDFKILEKREAKKEAIIDEMDFLGDFDVRYFYYSGHGSFLPTASADDEDFTEILIPYDHDWSDPLTDDDINLCFARFRHGTTYAIFDACHAYSMTREVMPVGVPKFTCPPDGFCCEKASFKAIIPNLVELSACMADQFSLELVLNGIWQGVYTWALSAILEKTPVISLINLQKELRKRIKKLSKQIPTVEPAIWRPFGV